MGEDEDQIHASLLIYDPLIWWRVYVVAWWVGVDWLVSG